MAILHADVVPKEVALMRIARKVEQGERVSVFGFPLSGALASTGNYSEGLINALSGLGDDSRFFQISAPVQPGNSGGPLLDTSGNLIGIVTAKLNALKIAAATGDITQNVNFAIKATVATNFMLSHDIKFVQAVSSSVLPPTKLADKARSIAVNISCY